MKISQKVSNSALYIVSHVFNTKMSWISRFCIQFRLRDLENYLLMVRDSVKTRNYGETPLHMLHVANNKQLLDKAMADIEIYSGELT